MSFKDTLVDFYFDNFWLGNKLLLANKCKYYRMNTELVSNFIPDDIQNMNCNELNDRKDVIRLCLISDTHDRHYLFTNLPHCDILIHSGDILMVGRFKSRKGNIRKLKLFNTWLGMQSAKFRIVIAGNHDSIFEELSIIEIQSILTNAIYLCNTSITILGLHIFGSPLSCGFSRNRAFQSPSFAKETFNIANSLKEVDILITHGRCPYIGQIIKPNMIHINGHVHRLHGIQLSTKPDNPNDLLEKKQYSHSYKVFPSDSVILPISNISNLHYITSNIKDNEKKSIENKSSRMSTWLKAAAPIMDANYQPNQIPIVIDLEIKQ